MLVTSEALLRKQPTIIDEIRAVRASARQLRKDFDLWPLVQPDEWQPRVVGRVEIGNRTFNQDISLHDLYPGELHVYFDSKPARRVVIAIMY